LPGAILSLKGKSEEMLFKKIRKVNFREANWKYFVEEGG
jgi:hypothetical protein